MKAFIVDFRETKRIDVRAILTGFKSPDLPKVNLSLDDLAGHHSIPPQRTSEAGT